MSLGGTIAGWSATDGGEKLNFLQERVQKHYDPYTRPDNVGT